MKAAVFVLLVLAIGAKVKAANECHMREIDLCMATGLLHFQSHGVPADEYQIDDWCETVTEMSDCFGNYSSKCLSPLQKELIGLFSGGGGELRAELCKSGTELRTRYLKYAECLSDGAESSTFKSHIKDVLAAIEAVFDTPFKSRLPTLCCGFRRFDVNVGKSTEEMCGADSVEMMKFMMDMVISDLPQTICRSYDPNSSECQALLPPLGTVPKGVRSQSHVAKLMGTVFGDS